MKKIKICICILLSMLLSLNACNGNIQEGDKLKDISITILGKSEIMQDEAIVFIKEGEVATAKTLFKPTEIKKLICYYNSKLGVNKEFTLGEDYTIEGNTITAISNEIPTITKEMLSGDDTLSWSGVDYSAIPSKETGKTLPFTETNGIVQKQLYITYTYDTTKYDVPMQDYKGEQLKNTISKLEKGENLEVFVYGDSVATGANSSSILNISPNLETWDKLFVNALEDIYLSKINITNKAVGAWRTTEGRYGGNGWINGKQVYQGGINETMTSLQGYAPDLAILHFGLNDGSRGISISQEEYEDNMKAIIKAIRKANSDVEIILINPHISNPMAYNQNTEIHSKFIENLNNIASEDNKSCVVDIAKIHEYILKTKNYIDTSANGVNHPNDYMARIYASTLLSAVVK